MGLPLGLSRAQYFRMAFKGLLLGLIMPVAVILGVAVTLHVTRDLEPAVRMLLALLGGFMGLAVSTLVLVKAFERMYRPRGAAEK